MKAATVVTQIDAGDPESQEAQHSGEEVALSVPNPTLNVRIKQVKTVVRQITKERKNKARIISVSSVISLDNQ